MTPERESLYKDARKRAQQILDICDAILESKATESRACKDVNFPVMSFRQFCKSQPKALRDTVHIKQEDWCDWRENLLHEITDECVQVPDDFDEIFKDICKTELSERTAKILRMRFEDGLTYDEIGKDFGVVRERIRQLVVKGIQTLRRPRLRNRLVYGSQYIAALSQHKTAQAEYDLLQLKAEETAKEKRNAALDALRRDTDKLRASNVALASDIQATTLSPSSLEKEMKETTLEELDLSASSYNSLRRYFFPSHASAWDVANLSSEELMKIRYLGRKRIEEIESKLLGMFGHGFFDNNIK